MWCPAVLPREAVFGRVSSVCHQDGWIHFCRVLYTAIGITSRLWFLCRMNWSWDFQGEKKHQKRENQSFFHQMLFKGRRCANAFGFPSGSLQLEHTAHCAGSVPLSPLLLEGLCSKTPEYLQCCHSACVSHLQQIWPSFSEFPYPLKVSSFAFTEQRSPSSSLKPLCWGPTIFC